MLLALLVLITVGVVLAMSQGVASLAQPFLDTLERYDLNRPNGVLEQLWDQTQAEVRAVLPCPVDSTQCKIPKGKTSGDSMNKILSKDILAAMLRRELTA